MLSPFIMPHIGLNISLSKNISLIRGFRTYSIIKLYIRFSIALLIFCMLRAAIRGVFMVVLQKLNDFLTNAHSILCNSLMSVGVMLEFSVPLGNFGRMFVRKNNHLVPLAVVFLELKPIVFSSPTRAHAAFLRLVR